MRTHRWMAAALAATLLLAACSSDDDGAGPDDSASDDSTPTSAAGAAAGPTTAPTAGPDGAVTPDPAVTIPADPSAIPIPEPGQATLVVGGQDVAVELNRCEITPEIGLDLSLNPPDAGEDNPSGFVLLTGAQPVPGTQPLGTPGAALQLPGTAAPVLIEAGQLTMREDLTSGVVQFAYQASATDAIEGYAAFACAPA